MFIGLRALPFEARGGAGYQSDHMHTGKELDGWKPMNTVRKGVREVRTKHTSGVFRIIYIAKLVAAVYVLHCFQKKTQRTSKADLDLAAKRYRAFIKEMHQ